MVCNECREGDHDRCEDTKHPHQIYRGCACQHQEAEEPSHAHDEE